MAEDTIYVGSRARVWLPSVNVRSGTEEPMDPAGLTVRVWKPDGSELGPAPTLGVEGGVPYVDFGEGSQDQAGTWTAQGFDGGFTSQPVYWRVYPNP